MKTDFNVYQTLTNLYNIDKRRKLSITCNIYSVDSLSLKNLHTIYNFAINVSYKYFPKFSSTCEFDLIIANLYSNKLVYLQYIKICTTICFNHLNGAGMRQVAHHINLNTRLKYQYLDLGTLANNLIFKIRSVMKQVSLCKLKFASLDLHVKF